MYTQAQSTSTIADSGARTTVPFGNMRKTIASRLSPKTRTFRSEAFSMAIHRSSSGFGQPTVPVLKSRVFCGRLSPSSSGLFKKKRNRAWCLGSAPKPSRKHLPNNQPAAWYYRARYYDPAAGRFLSEDPLGGAGNGPNFYAYVGNNPASFNDPAGLCPQTQCFAQMKYRPAPLGRNHSFWWIQTSDGHQWIISGGPTGPGGSGSLNVWIDPGATGTHFPADNSGAATAFDSGLSSGVCEKVDKLLNAARRWPNNKIDYIPDGPNSNSVAHGLGLDGGFDPPKPPKATGWPWPVPH